MDDVDELDTLVPLEDVARCDEGAPLPVVVASEASLTLVYRGLTVDADWDGTTARVVGPGDDDGSVVSVTFAGAYAQMFGPPDEQALLGHPLGERGLHPCGAFEVRGSSWVRELEVRHRVHPKHDAEAFVGMRHFVWTFRETVFECVARGYAVTVERGAVREVVARLVGEVG